MNLSPSSGMRIADLKLKVIAELVSATFMPLFLFVNLFRIPIFYFC